MTSSRDIKSAMGLLLSVLASLISLGSIAYAAGSLTQRVDTVEQKMQRLDTVPERLAAMDAKLEILLKEKEK